MCEGGARTDAARLTGVRGQAGVQQLRSNVWQRHAAVEAGAHKLDHFLVAHHVPHAVAGQHEEAVLRPQINLGTNFSCCCAAIGRQHYSSVDMILVGVCKSGATNNHSHSAGPVSC